MPQGYRKVSIHLLKYIFKYQIRFLIPDPYQKPNLSLKVKAVISLFNHVQIR